MSNNLKFYSGSLGTRKVYINGRGIGTVLLGSTTGGASALVRGPTPPDMEGGMMPKMRSVMPSMKKMKNIVF